MSADIPIMRKTGTKRLQKLSMEAQEQLGYFKEDVILSLLISDQNGDQEQQLISC
jgi:hypothetical protein